ncbi:Fc.00g021710.m01.CDS01 [Cosmosporella sp. VM-42]
MAPSQPLPAGKPRREMKVLALGLPRTGTASIAEALTVLGYQDVYHGIKALDSNADWAIMNRAADASFPVLPTYTGKPFTREEWDELYGSCEATTDVASPFATQLIETYPEAKVLLVIRDFDKWYKSINEGVLNNLWNPVAEFSINYIEPILGSVAGVASRKAMLGLFQACTVDEARQNARAAYDRHHAVIREMVPPENLLVYRMGEGWEPLCKFLGKPVPDVEFPWVNEAAELKKMIKERIKRNTMAAAMVVLPWVGGAMAVGAGTWMAAKRAGYLG